jgi:hypothetical protein
MMPSDHDRRAFQAEPPGAKTNCGCKIFHIGGGDLVQRADQRLPSSAPL